MKSVEVFTEVFVFKEGLTKNSKGRISYVEAEKFMRMRKPMFRWLNTLVANSEHGSTVTISVVRKNKVKKNVKQNK